MLAYILAIIIALTSLSLYLSAFFLPELHRQDDFLWSGIGLFYALVLWVCAERITGGILLGQSAAVILMVSFGWQTVRLRRAIAHPEEQTDLTGFSVLNWVKNRLGGKKDLSVTPTPSPAVETVSEPTEPVTEEVSPPISEEVSSEEDTLPETKLPETKEETLIQESVEAIAPTEETEERQTLETPSEAIPEALIPDEELPSPPPTEEPLEESRETPVAETEKELEPEPEPEKPKKKGFSLKSLFGLGKSKPQPSSETLPESSDQEELDLDEEDWETGETSEEQETVEAIIEAKEVKEGETSEFSATVIEETETATEEAINTSEETETMTTMVEGTEVTLETTPETVEIEQPPEKEQDNPEASIPAVDVTLEEPEETQTAIADDQLKPNESSTVENPQEINSEIENLETESSSPTFSDIFTEEKDEDKKSDEGDKK